MKQKQILIIALLALVSMLIMPVSGYELLQEFDIPINTAASGGPLSIVFETPESVEANVTYVIWRVAAGTITAVEGDYSGVEECAILKAGDTVRGNVSLQWSSTYLNATFRDWIFEFSILDFEDTDATSSFFLWNTIKGDHCFDNLQADGTGKIINSKLGYTGNQSAYAPNVVVMSNAAFPVAGHWEIYGGYPEVTTSFTCVPTSQFPNTDVVCTDTSTGSPDAWLWTIDAEAYDLHGWQTDTGQDFTWQAAYPGWYTVNLWVQNDGGGDWENKTNYVFISVNATPNNCALPIATGYSRTFFRCADTNTDASISGCDIQLQDIEGSSWSNVTDREDGIWCIDTLPLHNINAYGQATGYTDGSRIGVQEWNMMRYIIPMIPGYIPPPAAGYVWVYTHVTDFSGSTSLSGATVSLSGSGLTTQVKTTDSSGIAMIQWPNVTTAYINVAKSGYTTGMRVITTSDFGPDFVTVALHQGTYTSTITPTIPPGGITAAPTLDSRTTSEKDVSMMEQVRNAGPDLINLAILATIFGLIGLIGGSMKFGRR